MKESFGEKADLMLRKGLYFYDYADSFSVFEENEIPKPEHFFNTLDDKEISEKDYNHVVQVWNEMNIKNKGEYHDLYLKTDVLLLADVFENFRKFAMDTYELDPCHYYRLPGFAWDCLLKSSKV